MSGISSEIRQPLASVTAHLQYEVERFEAQARFAEGLCTLHPQQAEAWQALLGAARLIVQRAIAQGSLEQLRAAVREAEAVLTPLGATAKTYTAHCVGHAHIDMNWMWSWPETVAVTNDTFLTVLKLMEEFPTFRFSQSQASVYAIIARHHPALLERIAQRVREGRWEVTASHWVEGDKNLAGGESLTRHLLYTRRYMQELFGLSPEDVPVDWSPDTFGHAATIPTYLTRGGVKYLYLHRPGVHGPKKPDIFWWQAPDGSRVLVRNDMKLGYNQVITPAIGGYLMDFVTAYGGQDFMLVYGVGDHGGGPTRRDLLRGLDMDTWPIFPQVTFSTARAFFARMEKLGDKLPTIDYELNTEFTGCYTTQSLVKKVCRFGEARLQDAEVAAGLAAGAAGFTYPTADFREGWTDILFNHFHDILPGSGVHDTRTYTHGLFQKTMATTSQIEAQALRLLASRVDTTIAGSPATPDMPPSAVANGTGAGVGYHAVDGGLSQSEQSAGEGPRPFLLFNPTAHRRAEVVEATLWNNEADWSTIRPMKDRAFQARYPDGSLTPAQVTGGGTFWGHDYATVAFPAAIPSLGYALCIVDEVEEAAVATPGARQLGAVNQCAYSPPERSFEGLENDFLRMEIDPTTGGISRLIEKASGMAIVTDAPLLEYAVERPHGMTAWSIDNTGPTEYPQVTKMERTLTGPHKAALAVTATIHESELTVTYELRAGDPRLYLHIAGTWFQRGTPQTGVPALSLALPMPLQHARARYEAPFGAVDRDLHDGEEVPALEWAQVTGNLDGQSAGCLLCNDSKHGHSLDGNTLRLTLIRSSYDPDILPEIGQHEIHLTVQPFTGELPVADAARSARDLNHALRVVGTDIHAGPLPMDAQFVSVEPANVVVSTLKQAEAGDGVVLRLYETAGLDTTATVTVNADLLGKIASVEAVDLLERPAGPSSVSLTGNAIRATVPAHGITSIKIGR